MECLNNFDFGLEIVSVKVLWIESNLTLGLWDWTGSLSYCVKRDLQTWLDRNSMCSCLKKKQWAYQQFYCHFAFCQYLMELDNCYESKQFTTLRGFLCEGNKQIVHFKLQSCFRRAIYFWKCSEIWFCTFSN